MGLVISEFVKTQYLSRGFNNDLNKTVSKEQCHQELKSVFQHNAPFNLSIYPNRAATFREIKCYSVHFGSTDVDYLNTLDADGEHNRVEFTAVPSRYFCNEDTQHQFSKRVAKYGLYLNFYFTAAGNVKKTMLPVMLCDLLCDFPKAQIIFSTPGIVTSSTSAVNKTIQDFVNKYNPSCSFIVN